VGVAGELYIGGMGLGRGYWKRADLTGERFVPDPFSEKGGERLYRTGDRVRWKRNGELEFLGRFDEQVKLRGHRIELGEIEAALRNCQGVQQATVMLREDQSGDKRLVAYVVMDKGKDEAGSSHDLRELLRGKLPDYMVPAAVVCLEQWPLMPNGKLDRRQLPAPAYQVYAFRTSYTAPRTAVEQQIANIWAEILSIKQIGVEDNFFEIGGHSLLATRVALHIKNAFHVEISLRKLFESPTVAELAAIVEQLLAESNGPQAPSLPRIERAPRQKVVLSDLNP